MSSASEYLAAAPSYVIRSRWSCPISTTDLCSYIFTSSTCELSRDPIYIDAEKPETHNISLHAYRRLVKKIAQGLRECGLLPGQRVLVYSGNNVFYPSLYLGIIAAGGIFTGANPTYTIRELAYQLKDSGASFLISSQDSLKIGVEAADMVGLTRDRIFVFDDGLLLGDVQGGSGVDRWIKGAGDARKKYGVRHWSALMSPSDNFQWKVFRTEEETHQTAAINYSSGTTGVPKGVEITHRNFIANAAQVIHTSRLSSEFQILMHDNRQLGMLPMYHAYGQTFYVMLAPALKMKLYMVPKFNFLEFLQYTEKYKLTSFSGVPPIIVALAKSPDVAKFNLSSLRKISSGAAPLSKDIMKEVESKFLREYGKDIKIKQGWGMTEATCSVLGHHPEDKEDDGGSVGELGPNSEAKIVDTENSSIELPANQPGELYIRAPNVCKGYYNNPKATAETLSPDGWLKTGDIAYYSPQGKFYIVDRKKELIKVKGNQVAPAELESVLLENPKIADAAVIGIPNSGDERPRAYVVPLPDSGLTAEDVTKWVEERCTRYKWITGGVMFLNEIPKNPSGKILRRALREMAAKEVEDIKAKL
ncbi:acetyl-CoA synthetase-like protein [Wilcoxina mikolae CBS 423.85]|nr:acetyl-CoA synthetase-like protein [Wilcoxina mikolae CBS 423.85]